MHGESWKRIGFLRDIIEDAPGGLSPHQGADTNVFPKGIGQWLWSRYSGAYHGNSYHLIYLGVYQPQRFLIWLPVDDAYQFEVIDTWNMTIEPAEVNVLTELPAYAYPSAEQPTYELVLPGKPYLALRIKK